MKWNVIYNHDGFLKAHFDGYNHPKKGVPHLKHWNALQGHLKKCGIKVGVNPHYAKSDSKCLSPINRMGRAKGIVLLLETCPLGITVKIGHERNLVGDGLRVWPRYHSEYKELTFLERMALNWAYSKVVEYFKSLGLKMERTREEMSPEEYILHGEAINPHVHGGAKTLLDIKASITEDSYNWKHNSTDANKKKIVCGDKKCFYRNRRLVQGVAWHNINNMWWVICGNKLYNEACFELFDYVDGMPRRMPADLPKMERILKKFEAAREYQKCIVIQKIIAKMEKKDAVPA